MLAKTGQPARWLLQRSHPTCLLAAKLTGSIHLHHLETRFWFLTLAK